MVFSLREKSVLSSSITLSGITLAAPDGTPLLDSFDLTFASERTGLVGRNGVGKSTLLRVIAGEIRPATGTVRTGAHIALLRQIVTPEPGSTIADLFDRRAALALLDRAEKGAANLDELAEADWTLPARIEASLARFSLVASPDTRLATLSGGQRTRASLAALVFDGPDFILLDEPTNNLDRDGRRAVIDLLAGWKGGAIVVSHDRELLEHVDAIVEMSTLGIARHGGNWTSYEADRAARLESAQRDLAVAERQRAEAAAAARKQAERQQHRNATGRKDRARNDQPRILMNTRKSRAEETTASVTKLTERRETEAQANLDEAQTRLERRRRLTVAVASTGVPAGRVLLTMQDVSFGYRRDAPVVSRFSLTITGPERIAIEGPNGSGKTTILKLAAGLLEPCEGAVERPVRLALLDQNVALLDATTSIVENFRRLNADAGETEARAALARFEYRGMDAERLVSTLSGGQKMRAALACTLGGSKPPELIVVDEPTNHLDLETVEAMEAGLAAYDGGLLVVSHDEQFLERIGISRRIRPRA